MRQFLALFALLSGLAAISAPETARAGAVENALTELAEQVQAECETARAGSIEVCAEIKRKAQCGHSRPKRAIRIKVPAFHVKADRALE